MDEDGGQGVRMLSLGSQIRIKRGAEAEVEVAVDVDVGAEVVEVATRREVEVGEVEVEVIGGISNQNPSRIESEAVSLV